MDVARSGDLGRTDAELASAHAPRWRWLRSARLGGTTRRIEFANPALGRRQPARRSQRRDPVRWICAFERQQSDVLTRSDFVARQRPDVLARAVVFAAQFANQPPCRE